jgi:outer membrane protein assembly factor BamB
MMRYTYLLLLLIVLSACATLNTAWEKSTDMLTGSTPKKEEKVTNDSRIDVMSYKRRIMLDEKILEGKSLAEAEAVTQWNQEGADATQVKGHMKGTLLKEVTQDTSVGDGHDWIASSHPPSVVIAEKALFAMDGRGVVSAHKLTDIDEQLWRSAAVKSSEAMLVGGLATDNQLVFASNEQGNIAALDVVTGKTIWSRDLGFPLRSSLRYDRGQLFVMTASSELIVLNVSDGSLVWQHRGSDVESGIFGTILPAISSNSVLVIYPSGELYRIDRETGMVIWADIVQNSSTYAAIGELSGVDANPVITEQLVITGNSNGMMVANSAETGNRLWQQEFGIIHAPWVSNDTLYAISHDGNLSAHALENGVMAWYQPLKFKAEGDIVTARYYGPFLLNNTLVTLDNAGYVQQYSLEGDEVRYENIVPSVAATPSFIGDAAYIMSYGATVYKVQ